MKKLGLLVAMLAGAGISHASTDSPLSLTLEVDSAETSPHAPFRVWMTLANKSTSPVEGVFDVGFVRGAAVLEFGRRGGPRSPLTYLDRRTRLSPDGDPQKTEHVFWTRPPRRTLAPGEVLLGGGILAVDPRSRAFLLDREGEYELRATVPDPLVGGRLESNVVRVVARFSSSMEHDIADAFTPELAMLIQGDLSDSFVEDRLLEEAGAFVDRFPTADQAYVLRPVLRRELLARGSLGPSLAAIARRLADQERHLLPPVPRDGPERRAHDALNALSPEAQRILVFGNADAGEQAAGALGVPIEALLEAERFVRLHGGIGVAGVMRANLWTILTAKKRLGTIKSEEIALLERLKGQ